MLEVETVNKKNHPAASARSSIKPMKPRLPDSRVFILGAGFSQAAGVPLTMDLLPQMQRLAKHRDKNVRSSFNRAIKSYFPSVRLSGRGLAGIDIEDLLSLHECKHHTDMYGSEGWSKEGSKELLTIKSLLAEALSQYDSNLPSIYHEFASLLRPHDFILTFNWDTLLEEALASARKSFSLELGENTINVLKMHGSVDWKRLEPGDRFLKDARYPKTRKRFFDKIYQYPCLKSADERRQHAGSVSFAYVKPFIVLPSFAKLQWLESLKEYWYRTSGLFTLNVRQVVIIGYSLRKDDYHTRSFLIPGIGSFLYSNPNAKVIVIDPNRSVLANYDFVSPGRLEYLDRPLSDASLKDLTEMLA